jgi:hypothetical protein
MTTPSANGADAGLDSAPTPLPTPQEVRATMDKLIADGEPTERDLEIMVWVLNAPQRVAADDNRPLPAPVTAGGPPA